MRTNVLTIGVIGRMRRIKSGMSFGQMGERFLAKWANAKKNKSKKAPDNPPAPLKGGRMLGAFDYSEALIV